MVKSRDLSFVIGSTVISSFKTCIQLNLHPKSILRRRNKLSSVVGLVSFAIWLNNIFIQFMYWIIIEFSYCNFILIILSLSHAWDKYFFCFCVCYFCFWCLVVKKGVFCNVIWWRGLTEIWPSAFDHCKNRGQISSNLAPVFLMVKFGMVKFWPKH